MKAETINIQKIATTILFLSVFLLGSFISSAEARFNGEPTAEGQLTEITGVTGMALYPGDGMPLYPGDEKWEAVKGFTSTDGVYAVATRGNDVYVGGLFSQVGGQLVNNIARWDGSRWYPLGSGIKGRVLAIEIYGNDIYVGGNFSQAGGQPANYIARWDGSRWHSLGSGTNRWVEAIAVSGNDVYIGGYFTEAGGQPASKIARWDGSQWHALGSGIPKDRIYDIVVIGKDVYAGGIFTLAGDQPSGHIARWDGSQWYSLSNGVSNNGVIEALTYHDGLLYAGGHFDFAGGVPALDLARWNGSQWQDLALHQGSRYYRSLIKGLAGGPRGVYAVGVIDHVATSGNSANGIVWYNGNQWSNLGSGLTAPGTNSLHTGAIDVWDVAISGSRVYAVGDFVFAGNKTSPRFAVWHNTPELTIMYPNGSPGSVLTIIGRYFPPNTTVTIVINGVQIILQFSGASATLPVTNANGELTLNLVTSPQAQVGHYSVSIDAGGSSASTGYNLDPNQPLRLTGSPSSPSYLVSSSIPGYSNQIFIPTVRR